MPYSKFTSSKKWKDLRILWKLNWKQFWYKMVEQLRLLAVNHDNDPPTAQCAQIICGQKVGDTYLQSPPSC